MKRETASPRIAFLDFPHLSLLSSWRAHPELLPEPVVVGSTEAGGRHVVLAASAAALSRGVRVGQELAQAELSCPEAVRLEVDEAEVGRLRLEARQALLEHSPLIEWRHDDGAFMDLGPPSAQSQEPVMVGKCGRALQAVLGFPPRIGVGQSRFTAWAAAQLAEPGKMRLIATGRAAEVLAAWPVRKLPLSQLTTERLMQFGLRCCGDCLEIPLPDLQRQFGEEGVQLYHLCRGQDPALVHPWREPAPCAVRRVLAGAVDNLESLRFGAAELAAALAHELELIGRAAGKVRLVLRGEEAADAVVDQLFPSGQAYWAEIAAVQPATGAHELQGLILGLFDRVHPRVPVLVVELQALELAEPPAQQANLWQAELSNRRDIELTVARLRERFGSGLIWKIQVRSGARASLPAEGLTWRPG